MAENWSSLRELLVPALGAAGQRGRALEGALREAIRSGRLPGGSLLPGTRDLAAQLGMARGTVTSVYSQLRAEGYVVSRHGSGTRVADVATVRAADSAPAGRAEPGWRYNLSPGLPSLSAFPRSAWLKSVQAAVTALPDTAFGYPDPAGVEVLRTELSAYLRRVRMVDVRPENLIITNGVQDALGLLAGVLRTTGHTRVAVEDPSGPDPSRLLRAHGIEPVPVAVDAEGIRCRELARAKCRVALVTAAHQYPTGVALSPQRRREILSWARDEDAIVIEDDYDAEYRYDRPALAALQGMDPDRVVYVGSLSKTLSPALRLGWMVVPPEWRADLVRHKWLESRGCGVFDQVGFAELLRGGGYDRHLRRTRVQYRNRRDALLTALARHLPGWRPDGIDAGLHVVLRLPPGLDDTEVAAGAAAAGIRLVPLSAYAHRRPTPPALVCGFARLSTDQLDAAVAALAATLDRHPVEADRP